MALDERFNPRACGQFLPSVQVYKAPIISLRSPTTADRATLGQLWDNKVLNAVFMLTSIVAGSYVWTALVGGGGGETFSTVTITGSAANALNVSAGGATIAGNLTAGGTAGGAMSLGTNITTGTITIGGTAETGTITLGDSSGTNIVQIGSGEGATTVNIADGTTNAKTVNIGTGAAMANTISIGGTGANTIGIGDNQAAGAVNIGTAMTSGSVTIGSDTGTAQTNIVSADFISLQVGAAPINFYTGAGAPGNGLAVQIGDLYIRTDAGGPTERIYVATGVGAWTNVTCAA